MKLKNVQLQEFIESFDYHPDKAIDKSILVQESNSKADLEKRKDYFCCRDDLSLRRKLLSTVIHKSDLIQIHHHFHQQYDFSMATFMRITPFKNSKMHALFSRKKRFYLNLNEKLSPRKLKKYQTWFSSFDKIFMIQDNNGSIVHPRTYADLCLLDSIIQMDLDKFIELIGHIKFDITRIGPLAFEQVMMLLVENHSSTDVKGEQRASLIKLTEIMQIKLLNYDAKPFDFSNNVAKIKHWGRCQQLAVFRNQILLVRQLHKYGLFPVPKNCPNQEPLHEALDFQNYAMIEELLDMQFKPNVSMFYQVFKSREVESHVKINILCKMLSSEMSIDKYRDIVVNVVSLHSEALLSALVESIQKQQYAENIFELPDFQEVLNFFDITLFAKLIDVLKYPPVSIEMVKNIEKELNGNRDYKTSQIIEKLVRISLADHLSHYEIHPIVFSKKQRMAQVSHGSDRSFSDSSNSSDGSSVCLSNSSRYTSDDSSSISTSTSCSSSRTVLKKQYPIR